MKYLIFLVPIFIFLNCSFAQRELPVDEKPTFKDRVYFGGGGGLQLSQGITFITVSPLVGYMINRKLSAGVGVTYQYIRYKYLNESVENHNYGGRVFSRYNIFRQFYAMTEYEALSMESPLITTGEKVGRQWVDRLLLGGGYFQPIGKRAGLNIGAFYDLLYDRNARYYDSPWVYRAGLTF